MATTEELRYSEAGELLSDSANSYKVPSVDCIPADFRVKFLEGSENPINLLGSKAVGEPPFVLGLSVWAAAKQAVSCHVPGEAAGLGLPATSEEIMKCLCKCDEARSSVAGKTGRLSVDENLEAINRATAEF